MALKRQTLPILKISLRSLILLCMQRPINALPLNSMKYSERNSSWYCGPQPNIPRSTSVFGGVAGCVVQNEFCNSVVCRCTLYKDTNPKGAL